MSVNQEDTMLRDAFRMKLKPGCIEEYRKRHDRIWPELVKAHSDCGICDYSIYLDEETLTLFADRMGELDIVKKWWEYNRDLMEVNPDNSPVFTPLVEVFHMD